MLEYLKLTNVGPAPEMELAFGRRLNIVTGDNGLGKSFLLDVAWWALTRSWTGFPALPSEGKNAAIQYRGLERNNETRLVTSTFRRSDASWPIDVQCPPVPGIVIYVRIDGGFSVWDPARNYWRDDPGRPAAYHFAAANVWEGLNIGPERPCEGLERDWVIWQEGNKPQFKVLESALDVLSPAGEPLRPGPPKRLLIGEGRDRPTLKIGNDIVPVALASAGVRRVLALAYLLVWAWHEHRVSAELLGKPAENRVVVLFDEPETHLHPRWQRTLLPSLLKALADLRNNAGADPQVIVATHSPLVLASIETHFDSRSDAWFDLDLEHSAIVLRRRAFVRHGDVSNWLTSEAFDLKEPRSLEAEQAIERAKDLVQQPSPPLAEVELVDSLLRGVLSDVDRFWVRWSFFVESVRRRG